jgi:hypothetical protein
MLASCTRGGGEVEHLPSPATVGVEETRITPPPGALSKRTVTTGDVLNRSVSVARRIALSELPAR